MTPLSDEKDVTTTAAEIMTLLDAVENQLKQIRMAAEKLIGRKANAADS